MVNLLIAIAADPRDHHDLEKFAVECSELVNQIRRNEGFKVGSDAHLDHIQEHALKTLSQIKEMREELQKEAENTASGIQQSEDEEGEEIKPSKEIRDALYAMAGVKPPTDQDSEDIDPWRIEGMFTDHGSGAAREEGMQENAAKAEDVAPSIDVKDKSRDEKQTDHGDEASTGLSLAAKKSKCDISAKQWQY